MAALLAGGNGHASTWAFTSAANSGSISESVVKARSRRARNESFSKVSEGLSVVFGTTVRQHSLRRLPSVASYGEPPSALFNF
jgi:hypothetical protein